MDRMQRREEARIRLRLRHGAGVVAGYLGLFMGLMALLTTSSEGTPFAPNEAPWVVFGFMIGGYLVGWVLGPSLSRLTGSSG